MIHLDAEELAEEGLEKFYDLTQPELSKYISTPNPIIEIHDENEFYYVEFAGRVWPIMDENSKTSGDIWLNAAFVFFKIINQQLCETDYKFYAFYSGNDLSGMFLTEQTAQQFMTQLPNKSDWPYITTMEPIYNVRYYD